MRRRHELPFGAEPVGGDVRFRLWAPRAQSVALQLDDAPSAFDMANESGGWFALTTSRARPGSRYRFVIDGRAYPDPASRLQPEGVHGASEVGDPAAYDWTDDAWRGRPWHEIVLYEFHIGTFSEGGDFAGAIAHLDHVRALGATAVELMPVAAFPGTRNWGYDGVFPFAPAICYGRPEALKRLVEACHARGLAVFLDVVYNHFGPEGNYLPAVAPDFFDDKRRTPWGAALDFSGELSRPVRDFFIENALYWLEEFHFDGLRLDAVHAIMDDSEPDIVDEIAMTVRRRIAGRKVHLVLENDRNEARRLARRDGKPLCATAQWNDDLHHALHVLVTGETAGFYGDYADEPARHLGRALAEGFAYQGDPSPFRDGKPRGEPSAHLPATAFVSFIQNHDHVGNHPFGSRISGAPPSRCCTRRSRSSCSRRRSRSCSWARNGRAAGRSPFSAISGRNWPRRCARAGGANSPISLISATRPRASAFPTRRHCRPLRRRGSTGPNCSRPITGAGSNATDISSPFARPRSRRALATSRPAPVRIGCWVRARRQSNGSLPTASCWC